MKKSAGLLLYRKTAKGTEFFLVHPGGPFFARRHEGWWTVPKGEIGEREDPLAAAIREFEEETGYRPEGEFTELEAIRQKGGKEVLCWAVNGDLDPGHLQSNTFNIEWPPRSGLRKDFPEVDKGEWFSYEAARRMINAQQLSFLDQFLTI